MWTTIDSYNMSKGAEVILCYVNDITSGLFISLFLFAIFLVMTIGSYMIQKRQTGVGDFPVSMMVGSWTTLITAVLLRLVDCDVNPLTSTIALAVCFAMAIVSLILLFFSQE